ncbi:MAG: hypothetical protein CMP36_00365 [Rickettsiales bacterium]|nr:hypothetical protein [Rickettsiales bacterium]OUV83459.1 MAG: hypothetical protein CBC91_00600 [Rickettsiales bacterium TMED131]|tara:strand:- start:44 stop:787 length:744 start_codon:yes stop_codon:yes gene_type:complete
MKTGIISFLFFLFLIFQANSKKIIIADISENKINIDVGFKGASLLFFGVIDEEGDVVVSVTGPRKTIKVRKKKKVMGVWINSTSQIFYDVPAYYYVASTRPLKELRAEDILQINQVGINNIRFEGAEEKENLKRKNWIEGIINNMIKSKRYFPEEGMIELLDKRLFKTELNFSAELLDGEYLVDTLLLKDGKVLAARRSFINVSKSGYGEKIYKMAMDNSLSYGLIAVFFAMFFGFIVHEAMRRFSA